MNGLISISHHDNRDGFLEGDRVLAVEAELLALLNDFNTYGLFFAVHVFIKRKVELHLLSRFSRDSMGHDVLLRVLLGDLQVDAGVVEVLQVVFEGHEEFAIVLVLPADFLLDSGSPEVG